MLKNATEHSLFILTVYDGDILVGLVRVIGDGLSSVFIQDLLVRPDYQRQGLGRQLVQAVIEKYAHVYQLQLVTEQTAKSLSFYQALGFKELTELNCTGMYLSK